MSNPATNRPQTNLNILTALEYLHGLDPETVISLPGVYDPTPQSSAVMAIAVITDESPAAWAASQNRWEWTAGEILKAL